MSGLPTELGAAVAALLEARRHAPLAQRAQEISAKYRANAPSARVIGGMSDAVAYALSRMPATFAAVSAVLAQLQAQAPEFRVRTLLDAGAGPGTAAWAAAEAFTGLEAATLLDNNPAFLQLAEVLGRDHAVLSGAERVAGDLERFTFGESRFDLVTCAYALTELNDEALVGAVDRLWAHCGGVLAIIEPGRPRDYQRLMRVRDRLFAAGARIVAPCPHQGPCPLVAPDWCHFSVRLPRSRRHMRMKGASLAYEDEKFSYLVVARPEVDAAPAAGRIIRPPVVTKFSITLPTCRPDGTRDVVVVKRDGEAFRRARRLGWGDANG